MTCFGLSADVIKDNIYGQKLDGHLFSQWANLTPTYADWLHVLIIL